MTAPDSLGGAEPWWEGTFRTVQTNLREIDAGLDVDAVLDAIEEFGADTWLLSVGGIIANHPSRLASQTVNPYLSERPSGDLVGDATRAARARGIRVLARMDFSKIDAARAERHPEWCFVSPDGAPQIYNGYRSTCPSGEYYQREMFAAVAEVLEDYPVSGFFLNWMSFNEHDYSRRYWGVCQCEACRRGFARFAPGTALPVGPDDAGSALWRQYTEQVLADLHRRLREHVHRLAPQAALIQGERADITFHEANNAVGRELWHQSTADAVDAARSADPARPVFVNAVAFVDMPYRWAGEDPRHLEQYAVQAIAHGAQPSTYIMGTPEHSPFPGLEASARITRHHRDHQQEYRGLVPSARTALVRPDASADRAEFEGWHSALSEGHIPFVALRPGSLGTVSRERLDLVIVPDAGALDDGAAHALRRFADSGGTVVTTGSSAWTPQGHQLDPDGARIASRAVLETEEAVRSLHIDIGGTWGEVGPPPVPAPAPLHVPVLGAYRALVAASEEVSTGWPVLGRALYGPPEKCSGNEPSGHAGRLSWRSGAAGTVVVLPWRPGAALRELGLSAIGRALAGLVRAEGGERLRLATDLPSHVRVVPGRSAGGTMIHLLNRSGERSQRFVDPVPVPPAELEVPCDRAPRTVRALVAGEELAWSWADGAVRVRTPWIDVFEALVLTDSDATNE